MIKRVNKPLFIKQDPNNPILILRKDDDEPILQNKDGTYSMLELVDDNGNVGIANRWPLKALLDSRYFYIPKFVNIQVKLSDYRKDL